LTFQRRLTPSSEMRVDSSPCSVILMEMSWITEKELVVAGRWEVRPGVPVHTNVFNY